MLVEHIVGGTKIKKWIIPIEQNIRFTMKSLLWVNSIHQNFQFSECWVISCKKCFNDAAHQLVVRWKYYLVLFNNWSVELPILNKRVCSYVTTFTHIMYVYMYNINCPRMANILRYYIIIIIIKTRWMKKKYIGMYLFFGCFLLMLHILDVTTIF